MTRRRRLVLIVSAAGALMAVAAIVTVIETRPIHVKSRIERVISERLHLTTTIGALSVRLWPHAAVSGEQIEVKIPDRPDLPPFVAIKRFTMEGTPWSVACDLVRGHLGTVHVDGMIITVPPGDARERAMAGTKGRKSKVVVDHLLTDDAELVILRSASGNPPLVFQVHELAVDDLGFDNAMPFVAHLTNPVPKGEVESRGTIGPWRTSPSDLALQGTYTFKKADLDTIRGIGGMLTSTGQYAGTLTRIRVSGRTSTPDFNLDVGGKPLPLATTFAAVVDGSNGTTHLDAVDAMLYHTPIHVTGDIVNLPGPAGFDITLQTQIANGRVEDVLQLVMDVGKQPPLVGDLSLRSTVVVPAGDGRIRDRLRLDGTFAIGKTRFVDGEVQQKMAELSRRGQGKDKGAPMERVFTNMSGRFRLAAGLATLPQLTFDVPGSSVRLKGTYTLSTGAIDLDGQLRLQASLSDAIGGFKSVFLKPFDWLFRRDGAGTVIPIKITGTREHPKFGVRLGAALTRGK